MYWHIILTERCNLQCKYCYGKSMEEFDNGLSEKWKYDMEVPCNSEVEVSKLKEFLSRDNNPRLIFYGGEPLLQMDKIKEIMDKVDSKFYIQTNGVLLDKVPEEYLLKFEKMLVSIDGDEARTDFNRGEGRYKQTVSNIKKIRKKGFKGEIVARMTLSFPDVYEQCLHIIELIDKGIFDSVHFQLDAGFYSNDFDFTKFAQFVEDYNESIDKLLDFWVKEMRQGRVRKIYPFLGLFETIYYNKKSKLQCGSGHSNYTITTNGNLSACPIMNSVKDFYCGNLDSNLKEIKEINCGEPCTTCKYLDICGGRCLYSNYAKLWPVEGEKLICDTIINLIEGVKRKIPEIKELILEGKISEKDFEFEKYFGPEIIP